MIQNKESGQDAEQRLIRKIIPSLIIKLEVASDIELHAELMQIPNTVFRVMVLIMGNLAQVD